MIQWRRTFQIAPGRQADAVARSHEWGEIHMAATGIQGRVSIVTTGTLGRMCISVDYDSMGAFEAARAKAFGSDKAKALGAKEQPEFREGTSMFVPNTVHDEIWRDA